MHKFVAQQTPYVVHNCVIGTNSAYKFVVIPAFVMKNKSWVVSVWSTAPPAEVGDNAGKQPLSLTAYVLKAAVFWVVPAVKAVKPPVPSNENEKAFVTF